MGKLIVMEGTDGSGKSTQSRLLNERLLREGVEFRKLQFPRYDNPSSALIRMYLGGEFGDSPEAVNAFAASAFYAVDRYASFVQDWKAYYEAGGVLLSDRYTTSNAFHQGCKLPPEEQKAYWQWLYGFEYGKLGLPKPDLVLCLDLPVELTQKLMRKREQQTDTSADIHERDATYLQKCRQTAHAAAAHDGWYVVNCAENGELRSVEEIHEEIYQQVRKCLEVSTW